MGQKRWEVGKEGGQEQNPLWMQPATASTQLPVNHHLAQTLLVSAHPRLADSAHCSKRTPLDRTVASKCTILSSDEMPRQAWFSCSLKVNIYFSLLLLLILASLRHSTFRLTKTAQIQTICLGRWQQTGIFNGLHHQGLGSSLNPLWVPLSLKILPTELTGIKGFCTSSSESSPARCVQKQRYCVYRRSIWSCVSSKSNSHIYQTGEFNEPEGWYQDFSTLNMLTWEVSHETG